MVKISGADLDFYKDNNLRVRAEVIGQGEIVGYVQEYSIRSEPSDTGYLQLGDLPHKSFEHSKHLGHYTNHHLIPLQRIKNLEAAAIRDVNNALIQNSLPEPTCRELLGFIRR